MWGRVRVRARLEGDCRIDDGWMGDFPLLKDTGGLSHEVGSTPQTWFSHTDKTVCAKLSRYELDVDKYAAVMERVMLVFTHL